MTWDWHKIETYEGFDGVKRLAEQAVIPEFEAIPEAVAVKTNFPIVPFLKIIAVSAIGGFLVVFALSSLMGLIENGFLDFVLELLIVITKLVAMSAIVLSFFFFSMRDQIISAFVSGQSVFVARSKAWTMLADKIGLTYVPAPSGAPRLLKILATFNWTPPVLHDAAELLDAHSGMEVSLEVFKASGLALSNVIVLGNEAARANAIDQTHANLITEDGFHGERNGISFDMFEWVHKQDEEPDVHHLIIVMKAPLRLNSTTQLRSRKVPWPNAQDENELQNVDLGPKEFESVYRLRSDDQVEARAIFNPAVIERVVALAHGDSFRAVAKGEHIVFDIAGANRFDIVALHSGEWSDETIRKGLTDVAEALELIDALVHAFMLRNTSGGMTSPE